MHHARSNLFLQVKIFECAQYLTAGTGTQREIGVEFKKVSPSLSAHRRNEPIYVEYGPAKTFKNEHVRTDYPRIYK